ncbi:DUF6134 family protein [Variovorax sp. YR216]|uniref:DUF6134 family protein n=1 Tax=Variovorax sp. YR216 TaxID=1882828 RepID=UPI00089B7FCB|nr:DUF6134 family protein [Variovorax sp. YR216]SEB13745.1 hypothetical protein SAMN05444680_10951 [Variovorax sp. YR216]
MGVPKKALVLAFTAACAFGGGSAEGAEWRFRVLLDGVAIGEHRFSVTRTEDERRVVSEADFLVKFLGIPVYRYRHRASESWRGDCVTQLSAFTDDDGKVSQVRVRAGGDGRLDVTVNGASRSLSGCTMTFAYWNPALRQQTRLLNPQSGVEERVHIHRVGEGALDVRGEPVVAQHWRIEGPVAPLDVWYSAQGDWIGLDSTVAGGRTLSYRLQ